MVKKIHTRQKRKFNLTSSFGHKNFFSGKVKPHGPKTFKTKEAANEYAKAKGLTYKETLKDWAATHIFAFDQKHIKRATDLVMVMPAGKSGHLELGWGIGRGKRGYILFDKEPKRVDIMYQFATDIFFNFEELSEELKKY